MVKRKPTHDTDRTDLTQRILDATHDIRVDEIVSHARLARIPTRVRAAFAPMLVAWAPNRAWGMSFQLGDPTVTVGHRRGDHIATFPWLHDLSPDDAERLLCAQIEGTLLHELGHAIFDLYLQDHDGYKQAAQAAIIDGAPSSYRGQEVDGMAPEELLHEMFAEAFRYWCHGDPTLRTNMPAWDALAAAVVQNANRALK